MKNRFLKLLTLFMVAGSLFVGCGSNETGTDNGADANTDTTVNAEEDTKGDDVDAQVDLDKYEETDYYYMVKDEADIDRTYVDGTEMDLSDMENFNYITITIKDSINMYNNEKGIVGYTKPNIECLYFAANDEWSMIAFGTEPVTNEGYPNGAAIVKTEELKAAMEEVNNDDSTDDGGSEDSYVTEDIAKIKSAIEAAGLIYDESAFKDEDLNAYPNLQAYTDDLRKNGTMAEADVYGYLLNNLPMGMNDEQIIPAFTEFMKPYAGKSFMIEIISDEGRNYDFNVYIK